MKIFTYKDLKTFLLNRVYETKYYKLADYLRKSIGNSEDFNLFEYLEKNENNIILTAKNDKELNKKIKKFLKTKFKLMKFGIIDEIKSRIEDKNREL